MSGLRAWFVQDGVRHESLAEEPVAAFECPKCELRFVVPRDSWGQVTVREDGALSTYPCVVCPHRCGWSATIYQGVATPLTGHPFRPEAPHAE